MDSTITSLGWETNNNKRARPSNRDGCIHDGVRVPLIIFTNKNGGFMKPNREKKLYINALERKAANIAVISVTKNRHNV